MSDQKVTGDDDVPGDVLKLLGEDGVRIVKQLFKKLESGPKISVNLQKIEKLHNVATIAQ